MIDLVLGDARDLAENKIEDGSVDLIFTAWYNLSGGDNYAI
jgi:hypothetical protein